MPSWATCAKGHLFRTCREAAAAIAARGDSAQCLEDNCSAPITYHVEHHYPGKGSSKFTATHVVRLNDDAEAEREGYDPMLLVLKDEKAGESVLWTFYWTKNRKNKWHVGQFPPLFDLPGFRRLLQGLREPLKTQFGITGSAA